MIQYTSGDGNDTIYGFDEDDTLQIGGGTYSTQTNSDDLILTVDTGKIIIVGAANKTLNIDGEKISEIHWRLDGTTATYGTANETLVTVSGVKSLDGLSADGKVVTVSAAALNKTKVTISGDGNDIIANFTENDKIKVTKGTPEVMSNGSDVIFTVGKGSIKLSGAAGQNISVINSKGAEKIYKPTDYWFTADTSAETAELSSFVENYSEAYPLAEFETPTPLTQKNFYSRQLNQTRDSNKKAIAPTRSVIAFKIFSMPAMLLRKISISRAAGFFLPRALNYRGGKFFRRHQFSKRRFLFKPRMSSMSSSVRRKSKTSKFSAM